MHRCEKWNWDYADLKNTWLVNLSIYLVFYWYIIIFALESLFLLLFLWGTVGIRHPHSVFGQPTPCYFQSPRANRCSIFRWRTLNGPPCLLISAQTLAGPLQRSKLGIDIRIDRSVDSVLRTAEYRRDNVCRWPADQLITLFDAIIHRLHVFYLPG